MNNKIKKILVGIDFSDAAFNALETAASLAGKCGAELYIVHAHDNILDFFGINSLSINSVASNSTNILTALASDIEKKSGIVPVVIEETGYSTEVILKNAVNNRVDLVVMGAYGASGYRSGYIGTNAYSVIKFAPCPVLLIPGPRKWTSFNKLLFPIRPVMTALRHYDILRNFIDEKSTVHVLGLTIAGQDTGSINIDHLMEEMGNKLANQATARFQWGHENSVSKNVLVQAELTKADLIILTPAIDVTAKHFYVGPNTHAIIHNSKVPILVVNKVNIYALARPGAVQ